MEKTKIYCLNTDCMRLVDKGYCKKCEIKDTTKQTPRELKSEGDKWIFTHGGECKVCHRTELTEINKNDTCFECWYNY